jgi:hypothetical protein
LIKFLERRSMRQLPPPKILSREGIIMPFISSVDVYRQHRGINTAVISGISSAVLYGLFLYFF